MVAGKWRGALRQLGMTADAIWTHEPSNIAGGLSNGLGLGGHIARLWRLRRNIVNSNCDYVVSLMTYSNLLALITVLTIGPSRRPIVIVSEHNSVRGLRQVRGHGYTIQLCMARFLYKRVASGLVAVSSAVAAEAVSTFNLPFGFVRIIPNPVLEERGNVTSGVRDRFQCDSTVNLLFVGRMVAQKNPLLAVDIAKKLRRCGVSSVVHFFGDGPLVSQVEEYGRRQGIDCTMHGWVDSWEPIAAVDNSMLVLTSTFEGFGNVLVEASSIGIPVVAARTALGVSDAVCDGVTGRLATSGNAESFGAAILTLDAMLVDTDSSWFDQFRLSSCADAFGSLISDIGGCGAQPPIENGQAVNRGAP